MNNEQALQLLKESILITGTYNPSESFNNSKSVALELNDKPIILLGWEDDQESSVGSLFTCPSCKKKARTW